MVKSLPAKRETQIRSLDREVSLEKEMTTHSSILAWRIPWMEEPGSLQSMGLDTSWTQLSDFPYLLTSSFKYRLALTAGKESTCHAGDSGLVPRLKRSPGGGHGNPLQYSCLKNPMDRGVWWATVHGDAKSQTGLSN